MRRTTKKEIERFVDMMRLRGADISVEWSYGRPMCHTANGGKDLSLRLPTGQLSNWLLGYEAGYDQATPLETT